MNRLHEKGSAQLKYSFISNALCPVLDIDDATALKAVFRQNMLHNFVIPMCIHTDILKMFKAPVQRAFLAASSAALRKVEFTVFVNRLMLVAIT